MIDTFSVIESAHSHESLHPQLQIAPCSKKVLQSRNLLHNLGRLAPCSSRKALDEPARLAYRRCTPLMSAGLVAALSAVASRPEFVFSYFGNSQVTRFYSWVIIQLRVLQICGLVLFELTVGRSQFASCLCFFTKLAQISAALLLSTHPFSFISKLRSFTAAQLSRFHPASNEQVLQAFSKCQARQEPSTWQPYPWQACLPLGKYQWRCRDRGHRHSQ